MIETSAKPTKVYARFHTDKDGITYRTNTILQFGESWNIIGAAVLTNPGSAEPVKEVVPEEIQKELEKITGKKDGWSFVYPDPTIRDWLPRIFNGYFAHQGEQECGLNGIILLYNLFNIKNQNLWEAVELYKDNQSAFLDTSKEDMTLINKAPIVYLGWGNIAKSGLLQERASRLFSAINRELLSHYNPVFEKNTFYHPRAVNMGYKRLDGVKNLMSAFYQKFSSLKH